MRAHATWRGSWFVLVAVLLAIAPAVAARTIEGVVLPERVQARDGTVLQRHGAGVREKFLLDIHVGALYLPTRGQDRAIILERDQHARVEMHFLVHQAPADRMAKAWRQAFVANNEAATIAALEDRIDRYVQLFPTAHSGDVFVMEYVPNAGTQVRVNGEPMGTIAGRSFFRALLGVFLGPKPADPDLKRDLLGAQ